MEDGQIRQLRLRNHRLSGPPFNTAEEVLRWLGAMQSQEYGMAKWSIGLRAQRATDADLERAFADGVFLRTHVLRPTWHFVLPADIRWMLELTGPRVRASTASYYRKFGLDDEVLRRSYRVMARALKDGKQLTRRALRTVLQHHGIDADPLRFGFILMGAELASVVCSGAPNGKQQTYALLESRAPRARSLPRDDALAELTRRYFTSRGPATLKDYMWWSSLTAADARRGIDAAGSELERVVVGDRTYWLAAPQSRPRVASTSAYLLQSYDEYVIAYGESRDVILAGVPVAENTQQAGFYHALVLDGVVVGLWRRGASDRPVIEIRLVRSINADDKSAIEAAVGRFSKFVGVAAPMRVVG